MVAHKKETVEESDAFSQTPPLKTNSHSVSQNMSDPPISHSGTHNSKPDTATHGYSVKKVTNSFNTMHKQVEQNQGLNSVSIETDSYNESKKSTPDNQEITGTTIETGEFTRENLSGQKNYPLIIDETDEYESTTDAQAQAPFLKKEKPLQQQNILLDISSEFYNPAMPSETDQEQIGSGRIVGILGSGGMARVYKTWNEKLEIFRAVKILLPTNQKEQWDRFLTEAKITAKLHHPNIIEVYDTGEWHGLPFIEMEVIEGDTLNLLISLRSRLPSPVCSAVALQIAKALDYAHLQEVMIYGKKYNGIIHRDLKPSNIMLTSSGIVKLMDFGVARPIETGLHTIATDNIVGTMHYFSPEQISGYPVDPLSDVYSFGAVLYEMLCGINPFPQTNMVNLIQAKTRNQFTRIEDFHLNVDHRLASIAQRCLRTDKRERFENFNVLKKVLEEIHSSYGMGTSEEVISVFYKNHEDVQQMFEHFYRERQRVQNEQLKNSVPLIVQELPVESHHAASPQKPLLKKVPQNDTWEKTVSSHKHKIIIVLVVLVLVAIIGSSVTKGKFFKTNPVIQKYEQLFNKTQNSIDNTKAK